MTYGLDPEQIKEAEILTEIQGSDHCPILLRVKPIGQKIIDPPSNVPFPRFESVRPPGIFLLIRMQVPKGVDAAHFQQLCELFPLLWRIAGISFVGFRVRKIHRRCSNIEIAADYYRLFGLPGRF